MDMEAAKVAAVMVVVASAVVVMVVEAAVGRVVMAGTEVPGAC